MKILSILPIDIEAVTSHVADRKRKDDLILSSLPSYVCHSFSEAHLLLQENPLAYDIIVSAYTFDELLPWCDLVPGTRGPYGAATHHITKLMEDNPFALLVLWTGALSKEINLPHGWSERVVIDSRTVFPGYSRLLSGGIDVDAIELDLLRGSIERALTRFCLMLNDQDQVVLESICWRGLAMMTFQNPDHPLPVRLCLRRRVLSIDQDMGAFLRLLSQEEVEVKEIEAFLDDHPCFPIGNDILAHRWIVGLSRDGQDQGEPSINLLLEPVWIAQYWRTAGLKLPVFPCSQTAFSSRQSFCQLMATVLPQMRATHNAFKGPRFRRRMADAGLTGYSPCVILPLSGKDNRAFPDTPLTGVEKNAVISYDELRDYAQADMAWLAEPSCPPKNLEIREVYLRKHEIRPVAPRPGQQAVKVARLLTVVNAGGLDMHAVALIGKTVMRYHPHDTVRMTMAGCTVSASEIMSLLVLEASQGKQLLVEVEGPRAIALLDELTDLFKKGFYSEGHMCPVPEFHHKYCQGPGISSPVSGGPC